MAQLSNAMTEEEKMAAVFQAQTENFTAREEEMATCVISLINGADLQTDRIYRQQYVAKGGPKKAVNVPDHDPPQGYICYRCGEKGHWIQLCPTNDNPEYDNRPRVKRTTGIPKSFLKTVDKATVLNADGDESKAPAGIMVNPDGEWVIAEPDKASWEQFQAKAKSSTARKAELEGDKEVQERGLECSIDKKMFIDPMKTPCCEKTYCNDCITNALIESDFVCPACKSEGVLLDDLKPDSDAIEKLKAFLAEKDNQGRALSKSPSAPASPVADSSADNTNKTEKAEIKTKSKSPSPSVAGTSTLQSSLAKPTTLARSNSTTPVNGDQSQGATKKRVAEDPLENPKIPKAPKAMQKQQDVNQQGMMDQFGLGGMNAMNGMNMASMPMMYGGMPMMNGFGGMGMPNMPMGMMNPMMAGAMQGFGNFGGFGFGGFGPGMQGNGGWGGAQGGQDMSGMGMNNAGGSNMNMGNTSGRMNNTTYNPQQQQQFNNQQQPGYKNFTQQPADEDDAYFRKPVNPHRHNNRQRRVRPSDYREL